MADRSRIIDRIIKLFRLGTADRNSSENEVEAAMTKARMLMAEHDIAMSEVELMAGKDGARPLNISVVENLAYTRKIRDLAPYDYVVANAVCILTTTTVLAYRGGGYTKLVFVGTPVDVAVGSELFIILLQTVRRLARQRFGSAKWDKQHTSFAIGCAARLRDRAAEAVRGLTPTQQTSTALIVRGKEQAIDDYLKTKNLREGKKRNTQIDSSAFIQGYEAGAGVSLRTRTLKSGGV